MKFGVQSLVTSVPVVSAAFSLMFLVDSPIVLSDGPTFSLPVFQYQRFQFSATALGTFRWILNVVLGRAACAGAAAPTRPARPSDTAAAVLRARLI